jgi:hypothetical protein
MKNKQKSITSLGTIAIVGLFATAAASAATTSSKAGMQTTDSAPQTSYGDGLPMLAPGVQELSLGGKLNWEDDTLYNFDVSYGRFITSNWLIGASAGITGVNSDTGYTADVFGEYNFLTDTKWVPYIGAKLGYTHPNDDEDGVFVGADLGVKYFMRSNLAIFGQIGGAWNISGDDSNDGIAKQIELGLNFYF